MRLKLLFQKKKDIFKNKTKKEQLSALTSRCNTADYGGLLWTAINRCRLWWTAVYCRYIISTLVLLLGRRETQCHPRSRCVEPERKPASRVVSDVQFPTARPSSCAQSRENVNRWRGLFLRMQKRGVLPSCTGGSWSPDRGTGLYGRPLLSVCGHDRRLPRPIREVLAELWSRAPATEGVFRKPGNAKRLSEIKARLEAGEDLEAEAQPVLLLAALLKDFLRQLPDGLLGVPLYPAWMSAMEKEEAQRCSELRQVSDRLPKANVHLLQCLLLVLRHISRSADANKMDARNLAVCISPNLLPVEPLSLEKVEKVTALTQFLIENCGEIFGDGPQTLAVDPAEEDRLADSTDSLSSHGQDSAYDSADPEAEADPAADRPPSPAAAQEMAAATPSRPALLRRAPPPGPARVPPALGARHAPLGRHAHAAVARPGRRGGDRPSGPAALASRCQLRSPVMYNN
ncbi:hypothetical protein ANANG_G00028860 [Anguilla anguilla]|uniref:Rho-GAP domain-containing protein n=1 Tax=Anguilla anguilla TaxID=7936 RepID=A0A9D3MRZ8_ANGAN|nr:hypothetical protein ANANG_G00028860 [Anguilla anguilla]